MHAKTISPVANSVLQFRDVQLDVIDRDGQRWLRGIQIGEALEYANPRKAIRNLYEAHADEFTGSMTALIKLPDLRPQNEGAGQMREVRVFSLRGAHLLGMFAETSPAKEFRCWLLDLIEDVQAPSSAPIPAPAAFTSPDFLDLRYNRRPLRITRLAGGFWYGACGLARALGWIDSASITRHMSGVGQMRVVPHGGRTLMLVDHATLLDVVERAEPRHAAPFLRWLDRVLRAHFGTEVPALPGAAAPLESLAGEGRQLALDYLGECRQILARHGERLPAMDAEAARRVADGLASQLLAGRRWVLSFNGDGLPVLTGIEHGSVLLDLRDAEHLALLLREQVPADALPRVLDAGLRRLGTLALPSR